MLEFTMSRVVLCVCGVILLGSVCIPLLGMYSTNENVLMTESTDSIAAMIDSFYGSEADTMILRGWDILPGNDCSLNVDGHNVTLSDSNGEYRSLISYKSYFSLSYNEMITLERSEDGITVKNHFLRSDTALSALEKRSTSSLLL